MRALREYLTALSQVEILEPDEEQSRWQKYKQEGHTESRTRIIEAYQPLVFKQVMGMGARQDQLHDLNQEGTVGLIEAVEAFNPERGIRFATFARHRIRGRLLNYLTSKIQYVSEASCELWNMQDSDAKSGQEIVEEQELSSKVAYALSRLPDRERAVIRAVYLDEEQPGKIAEEMEISASYLYKLQKRAVRRLRGMLAGFIAEVKMG